MSIMSKQISTKVVDEIKSMLDKLDRTRAVVEWSKGRSFLIECDIVDGNDLITEDGDIISMKPFVGECVVYYCVNGKEFDQVTLTPIMGLTETDINSIKELIRTYK